MPLYTSPGEPLTITVDVLVISDPDIDPAYHVDYALTVYGGDNYTVAGAEVAPEAGFTGILRVPVSVNDGAAESPTFELRIDVGTVADTVPPEITLIGPATVTVQLGAVYTDAGATATDNVDGDITDRIVVDNPVDTGRPVRYTVSYSVVDKAGNRTLHRGPLLCRPDGYRATGDHLDWPGNRDRPAGGHLRRRGRNRHRQCRR